MKVALADRLEQHLGARPVKLERLHGGCIAQVYAVTLPGDARVVVKVDDERALLGTEAMMLRYLQQNSALPVPDVIHASETLLVLEYLPGQSVFSAAAQEHAADLLASLHSTQADAYGFVTTTLVGPLAQPNPASSSWLDFFREQRLLYMTGIAHASGHLTSTLHDRLHVFAQHLDTFLDEPEHPSLIHGDIWSSNVLAHDDRITGILDPALYYADAEMELAFIMLFNTFGEPFFERYAEKRAIRPGFLEVRKDIYNLYPLLVHVTLFGGTYIPPIERTLERFGF